MLEGGRRRGRGRVGGRDEGVGSGGDGVCGAGRSEGGGIGCCESGWKGGG